MNATIVPNPMPCSMHIHAPTMHTTTYPRFPTALMKGIMSPPRNCDLNPDLNRSSLMASNPRSFSSSSENAFTTSWPEYVSSTKPFIAPRSSCCLLKCFWERDITTDTTANPARDVAMAAAAIQTLVHTIMIPAPMKSVAEEITVPRLSSRFPPTASASLVTRLMVSPTGCESK